MKKKIKLFDPYIDNLEKKSIIETLESHYWASGDGSGNVRKFEKLFTKYVGAKESVAVNSGTAALNLALSLIDLKGKEVILPSLSFVSTAHAVILNGGIPIFVDIDPQTLCIDADKIKQSLTSKSRVILPVHFGGMPCNLNEIQKICKENNIFLIEDAAHASGSKYQNQKVGSHGFAVCFSFHPVKNLAMPTGGIISLNSKNFKSMKKTLLARRWCGITNRHGMKYDVKEAGWNYYMNEFSAGIGIAQLKKLDKMNLFRKKIAKRYEKELRIEQKIPFTDDCSYHLYWIQTKNRNSFIKNMQEFGIEVGIHYKPIHKMTMYNSHNILPITERVTKAIVTLPIHPNLTENDIDHIIKTANKFAR